jgi:RHS repeat-associated protein
MQLKGRWWWRVGLVAFLLAACSSRSDEPTERGASARSALTSCAGLPEWAVVQYVGGARVQHRGSLFECKPWPYSGWCGQVGYEPGVAPAWPDAWVLVDACGSGNGTGGQGGTASAGAGGTSSDSGGGGGVSGTGGSNAAPQIDGSCLANPQTCCPSGFQATVLSSSADTFQSSVAASCIVGLEGNDTIAAQGSGSIVFGGPGNDTIQAANGNNIVVPGAGIDNVATGTGNDTVYIFDACEAAWGDTIDMGSGDDTLVSPLSLAELQARGLTITNVDHVVVQQNSCRSECATRPNCSGHGHCAEGQTAGQTTCACDPGYSGTTCNVPTGGGNCSTDADCTTGRVCWHDSGRHFNRQGSADMCAPPECLVGTGPCGDPSADCGRCDDTPKTCASSADCAAGEVCGTDNGAAFGLPSTADVCWEPVCNSGGRSNPDLCGSVSSPCGVCDCNAECAAKACGDDPANSCGNDCTGLCGDGEPGCNVDADCAAGSICGQGIGARFGFAASANVCWPAACAGTAFNYPGFGEDTRPTACGTPPACVADCSGNRLEDGCGGYCFTPTTHQLSGPGGATFTPILTIPRGGPFFPKPLPAQATAEVGALAGALRITDQGTANYTIPIEVPPGRLGLQPEIALTYLGTKTNGLLGLGWNVTGLSTIARCRTTHAQAPDLRPVMLDFKDRFCLDGETLVQVHTLGKQYGDDGAEYVLEKDTTKLRITSHKDQGVITGYFSALTREGRTLTFGKTNPIVAANGVRRVWALEEVEDSAQNFMTIRYVQARTIGVVEDHGPADNGQHNTGELLPRLISYGGSHVNSGSQAAQDETRFVYFNYEQSTRPAFQYIGGETGYSNWRLTNIQTFVQDTKVKTYKVSYPQQPRTGELHVFNLFAPQQVKTVEECADDPMLSGADKEVCKPATTFEYVDASAGYQQTYPLATVPLVHQSAFNPTVGLIVLDANGDGRDDLIATNVTNMLEPPVLSAWSNDDPALAHFNVAPDEPTTPLLSSGQGECFTQSSVIDLNRDGKDDLISVCRTAPKLQVYYSESEASTSPWRREELNIPMGDSEQTLLADYNGDGLKDLIVCHGNTRVTAKVVTVHRNTGSTFETEPLETIFDLFNCHNLKAFDADGDGDDDLLDFNPPLRAWRPVGQFWQQIAGKVPGNHLILDFNGDGLKDIVNLSVPFDPSKPNNPSAILVWYNTGKGFSEQVVDVTDVGGDHVRYMASGVNEATALDIDGDGAEDVVTRATVALAGSRAVIRFVDRAHAQIDFLNGLPPIDVKETRTAADLNGDGSPELVFMTENGKLSFAAGIGGANLLHRVRDGLGHQDQVEYAANYVHFHANEPLRTYSPDACRGNSSFTCLQRVTPLVSQHFTSQIDPATLEQKFGVSTDFTYLGAVLEAGGHGWLGFTRRTMQVPNLSMTTVDYVTDDFRRAGLPLKATVERTNNGSDYSAPGTRTDVAEYGWNTANVQSPDPDAARFPFLQIYTETAFSDGKFFSRSQTNNGVDNFNNVISSSTRVITPTSLISLTTVDMPRFNDVFGHKLGLVDHVEVHSTRGGFDQIRKTAFTYDARGLTTTETRQPDDQSSSTYQQTVLTPNEFGVVDSKCIVTSAGVAEQRCASVELDDWSIYPKAVTEVGESLTTEYVYGAEAGQLLVRTEPSGVATEYAYDAFGRLNFVHGATREGPVAYQDASPRSTDFADIKAWGAITVASQFSGEGFKATTYDAFGRPVQARTTGLDDTVVVSESLYDELGRLDVASLPHATGSATQGLRHYAYDTNGKLEAITDPDGSTTHVESVDPDNVLPPFADWFQDDDAVEATVVKLPRGNQKIYVRDSNGNVVRTFDDPNGLGGERLSTRFTFGEFDGLRQVTTPKDVTQFYPDAIGRPEAVTTTSTGSRSRVFSGFDQLVSETDGNADTVSYHYDRVGRRTEELDAGANTIAKWEYDGAVGRGLGESFREFRRSSPASTVGTWTEQAYEDGDRGRPTVTKYRVGADISSPDAGGELFTVGLSYKFNAPGQIDTVSYPSNAGAFVVQQDYDLGGNLRTVSKFGQGGTNYWHLIGADEGLRPKDELFGNGAETIRSYHHLGEADPGCALDPNQSCRPGLLSNIFTTGAGGAVVQNIFLSNDRNGNVLSMHEGSAPGTRLFDYDGDDRLVGERLASQGNVTTVKDYQYDSLGNMKQQTGLPTFVYDSGTARLDSVGDTEYVYDGNGNQTERIGSLVAGGYQKLDLNELEMPWHISQGQAGAEHDVFLEYSADEERVVKREQRAGGGEKVTLTIGDLYERVTTPNGVEHHYKIYGATGQIADVVRHGSNDEGEVTYLHSDQLGSPRVLTDASGSVIESRDFEPFGKEAAAVDWNATGIKAGFTSHSQDNDLGLINMKGRLYDPVIGQFTSADPFISNPFSALGWDRYAYVQNNPLAFLDPSGFSPQDGDYPVPGGIQPVDKIGSGGPGAGGPSGDPRGSAGHNDAMEAAANAQGNSMSGSGHDPGGGGSGGIGQPSLPSLGDRPFLPGQPYAPGLDQRGLTAPSKGMEMLKRLRASAQEGFWKLVGTAIGRKIQDNYKRYHPRAITERGLGTIADRLKKARGPEPRKRPDIFDPDTGALYEIKPRGWEERGAHEANEYIAWLAPSIIAHPGSSRLPEGLGTAGKIYAGGLQIDFSSMMDGTISYSISISPEALGALAGATLSSIISSINSATVTEVMLAY